MQPTDLRSAWERKLRIQRWFIIACCLALVAAAAIGIAKL